MAPGRPILIAAAVNVLLLVVVVLLALELGKTQADLALERAKAASAKAQAGAKGTGGHPTAKVVLSRPFKPVSFTVDFFGMQYLAHSADLVDMHVFFYGAFEKYLLFFMRDILRSLSADDGIYIDVGASKGHHALFMSKHAKVVHAIEPYRPVLVTLERMIALNGIQNIVIHPVGLGDRGQALTFYEPPAENMGTGTFIPSYISDKKEGNPLPIVRGDALFAKAGITRAHLIKIDIEGYEKRALRGLRRTLAALRPVLVVEVTIDPTIPEFFKSEEEIRAHFPKGYLFRLLTGKTQRGRLEGAYGLAPFALRFDKGMQVDIVAFPPESAELVTKRIE